MYKLAIWIVITLLVAGMVIAAPMLNPAVAAEQPSSQQDNVEQSGTDEIVATGIELDLIRNTLLQPYDIWVDVDNGVVTLQGEVSHAFERDMATHIALEQAGVRDVYNDILVSPTAVDARPVHVADKGDSEFDPGLAESGPQPEADEDSEGLGNSMRDAGITAKVKGRLLIHLGMDAFGIDVDTENQVVELTGELDEPRLIPIAEQIAASTPGVHEVKSHLEVEDQVRQPYA